MNRILFALAFALINIISPVRAKALLQIDYGWRTDGRSGCTPGSLAVGPPSLHAACIDPIADLEKFAQSMDTQFSSNPSCHNIILVRFPWGPLPLDTASKILDRPHWSFFVIAYNPGDDKQSWKLVDPSHKSDFAGHEEIKEIVREVCGIVTGVGGSLLR